MSKMVAEILRLINNPLLSFLWKQGMIYFSFKLEAEMERKFVIIETLEDDGSTTQQVVEVFELIDENEG